MKPEQIKHLRQLADRAEGAASALREAVEGALKDSEWGRPDGVVEVSARRVGKTQQMNRRLKGAKFTDDGGIEFEYYPVTDQGTKPAEPEQPEPGEADHHAEWRRQTALEAALKLNPPPRTTADLTAAATAIERYLRGDEVMTADEWRKKRAGTANTTPVEAAVASAQANT